ncbi:MAG TPA: tetratricopeptide repeat protein, partial [Burkholderiales bacterium]|nr:tetratricopeptide repeat protein [Burkholderiales bacterium]
MNLKTLALIASLVLAGCGGLSPRDGAASLSPPLLAQRQNERGLVLAASGRYGEAASQFQAAIALEPRAAYLHNNLGFAHLQRGALEQAVAEFEEATRLDPAHPQAVVNLANARAALERRQAVAAQPRTPPAAPKAPNQDAAAPKEQARPDLR